MELSDTIDSDGQFVVKIETLVNQCLKGKNSRKILKFWYRVSKIKKIPKNQDFGTKCSDCLYFDFVVVLGLKLHHKGFRTVLNQKIKKN